MLTVHLHPCIFVSYTLFVSTTLSYIGRYASTSFLLWISLLYILLQLSYVESLLSCI
jgi:hypothetical protein